MPSPPVTDTYGQPPIQQRLPTLPAASKSRAVDPGDHLQEALHTRLGKCVTRDAHLVRRLGWEKFVRERRGKGDLTNMDDVKHPAKAILRHLSRLGAPAVMADKPWTPTKLRQALHRGPHKSCHDHHDFLAEEFADFVEKGHWVVLPFDVAEHLPGLCLSPPGVVPQHERLIADLSWAKVNNSTLPLAPSEAMQFGRTLQRIVTSVVRANPRYGPVHTMKVDLSDGFYQVGLQPRDCPKLALVLPALDSSDRPLVAIPLALPMGWVESPPWFSAVTETGADLANRWLCRNLSTVPPHRLDAVCDTPPEPVVPQSTVPPVNTSVPAPSSIDPELARLQSIARRLQQFDIYVDDYIGLVQGSVDHRQKVQRVLLHTINKLFRPLAPDDPPERKEPVSVKKAKKGDAYWETRKLILGWMLDTVAMTLELSDRRRQRLYEILNDIPKTQRRISIKKCLENYDQCPLPYLVPVACSAICNSPLTKAPAAACTSAAAFTMH